MGRLEEARQKVIEAIPSLSRHDRLGMLPAALGQGAYASFLVGDREGAEGLLARIDPRAPNAGVWLGAPLEPAQAWSLVERGRIDEGRRLLLGTASRARSAGQRGVEASLLAEVVRLGSAEVAAQRFAESGDEAGAAGPAEAGAVEAERVDVLEGQLPRLLSRHAGAAARRDCGALLAAATDLERIGAYLYAAEAASAAADISEDCGVEVHDGSARVLAIRLASRCPGVRTPLLGRAEPTAGLSAREEEVAILAARGLSSRAIAARLVVSPRTVDNHLHRAYRKLGVPGRESLVDLLSVLEYPGTRAPR